MQQDICRNLSTRIINTFGETGERWLSRLPELIRDCEACFDIKIHNPLPHLTYHYVADASLVDGKPCVAKIAVIPTSIQHEANALKQMSADGVVMLLAKNIEKGFLLLERLTPGDALITVKNERTSTQIAADLIQRIAKPLPQTHHFASTQDWFDRLDESIILPSGFSMKLIDAAREIALDLHQENDEQCLLHGDLHHNNILSSERDAWLAIDPKGVIGPREYEVGAWLRNPIPTIVTSMDTQRILANRIAQFAELLGFDKQKMQAWAFSQAVLAAVWCVDDGINDWRYFLSCAGKIQYKI